MRTILHAIDTGGIGGAESVLLNIASGLDPTRFRSVAIVLEDDALKRALEARGIRTYVVNWSGWYDPRLLLAIIRVVRAERVDLLHAHLPYMNFYASVVGWLTGRKVVVTYHGAIEFKHAASKAHRIKTGVVRRTATSVVVVCEQMRGQLTGHGFRSDSIVRIYNGVNASRYDGLAPGTLRRDTGIPAGGRLVGMVANVRESKGYEFFVQAAQRVLARFPDTHFVAVGDIDPVIGAPILALVREQGLESRVHFVGFRADIPEVLADLDVFVLSSLTEGFPLVILEAMAARRAVVATQCGGIGEMIEDGRNGRLVPVADARSLADVIEMLLGDDDMRTRFALAARAEVESRFSFGGMTRAYEALYDACLNGRPIPPAFAP